MEIHLNDDSFVQIARAFAREGMPRKLVVGGIQYTRMGDGAEAHFVTEDAPGFDELYGGEVKVTPPPKKTRKSTVETPDDE